MASYSESNNPARMEPPMFTSSFLTQSSRVATVPAKSRMFWLRATRRPLAKAFTVGTVPLFDADSMRPLADEVFAVAPAIADINVVAVEPDLPHLPEVIQPADIEPTGSVNSVKAAPVASVDAAQDKAPTMAEVPASEAAVTLSFVEEIAATLPATNAATAEPELHAVVGIITTVPPTIAITPADTVAAGAPLSTPTKVGKRGRKPQNEVLGDGAEKPKKSRRKWAKKSGASEMPDLTNGEGLPLYDSGEMSGTHSPS
jgi:hypothetical protein